MESIYMDRRWGKLQEVKEKGTFVPYVFEQAGMRLNYPFIKRPAGTVAGKTYYDLATPRGESGLWIEGGRPEDYPAFIEAFDRHFQEYCQSERIVAEFIRFSPWQDWPRHFSTVYTIQPHGKIYYNDLRHDFFNQEYPKGERRDIRKAKEAGITVEIGNDEFFVETFLNLYSYTAERHQVSDYYRLSRGDMERYLAVFPQQTYFTQASMDGLPIASEVNFMSRDIFHAEFIGELPQYRQYSVSKLIAYHSACFARDRGLKIYSIGGAKEGTSLAAYKSRRSQAKEYCRGTRIRDAAIYDILVEQTGEQNPDSDFFPAYRRRPAATVEPEKQTETGLRFS